MVAQCYLCTHDGVILEQNFLNLSALVAKEVTKVLKHIGQRMAIGPSGPRKSTSSPLKYPFNFCSCPPPQVSAPQCLLCPPKNFSHVECHASTNHNIYDLILRLDCSMKDALCILLSNPPQQCPRRMRAALGIQIIDRRERKRGVVSALETTRGNRKTKQNTRETQTAPQRVRSVRRRRREESQQETGLRFGRTSKRWRSSAARVGAGKGVRVRPRSREASTLSLSYEYDYA